MADYNDLLNAYAQYIQGEEARLAKRRPELYEEVASELASRGLLGGGTHIRGLGAVQKAHEDYLAELQAKKLDLQTRIIEAEIERRQREKEARKARTLQYATGIATLLTTPWKYKEGLPEKTVGGSILDWLMKRREKSMTPTTKAYERRGLLEKGIPFNSQQSLTRPRLGQGSTGYGFGNIAKQLKIPQLWD
ncbi:MAG: hypothetical protein AB1567_10530 [bacterium]